MLDLDGARDRADADRWTIADAAASAFFVLVIAGVVAAWLVGA